MKHRGPIRTCSHASDDSRHRAAATWQSAQSRRNMAVGTKPQQTVGTKPQHGSRHKAAATWQSAHSRSVGTKPPQHGSRHTAAATWQSAQSRRNHSRHKAAATWQSAHSRRKNISVRVGARTVGMKPPQDGSWQKKRRPAKSARSRRN